MEIETDKEKEEEREGQRATGRERQGETGEREREREREAERERARGRGGETVGREASESLPASPCDYGVLMPQQGQEHSPEQNILTPSQDEHLKPGGGEVSCKHLSRGACHTVHR